MQINLKESPKWQQQCRECNLEMRGNFLSLLRISMCKHTVGFRMAEDLMIKNIKQSIVVAHCERMANCNCIDCDISIENPLQTAKNKKKFSLVL